MFLIYRCQFVSLFSELVTYLLAHYPRLNKSRIFRRDFIPSRGSRHWPIHSVSIIACPMLGNPRKFWILDSTPWIPDSRYWIPVFFNGTWILAPIVGGIPDSLSCTPNPHAKISQITESGFPYTGRYGHQIALCSSNCENIYAVYDQNAGDRRWNIQCVYNKAAQICKWSSYYHTSFKYECQGFISGKYNPITY